MRKAKRCAGILTALLLLQTTTLAWGDNGHMTVAQIAFNNLDSPQRKARADELAGLVEFQDSEYEFVTVACWMDDIRDAPMFEPLKDWHFITQRLIVQNAVPDEPPPLINAASMIEWLIDRLKTGKRDSDLQKAFYLAELVHLTGDIHQPLHGTTRFTPDNPDGDRGGNFFRLSEDAPRSNLHSYWDAGGMLFGERNVRRPLTQSGRARIVKFADEISESNPRSSMTAAVKDLNPRNWAKESFGIARDVVYVGVKEGGVPNEAYQKKAQETSRKRVALAGYRLAAVLNQALP